MPHATLQVRLAALEREVEQLKRRLDGPTAAAPADNAGVDAVVRALKSRGILTPDPTPVTAYLRLHPDLLQPLESIVRDAHARLPEGTELSLELYRDPETAEEYLTLYARHAAQGTDLMGPIDELSNQYDPAFAGRSGRLLLTTDFLPPRTGRGGNGI